MGTRGRTSAASLSVVTRDNFEAIRRPRPPDELTDEQARIWREIVDQLPADWFRRENFPLLVQYCRHVSRARHLAQLIERVQDDPNFGADAYAKLLQTEEQQSRALAALATRMRLSQQSSYSDKKAKAGRSSLTIGAIGKPWRDDED